MATEPLLLTADAVAPMGFSLPPILRDAGVVVANGVILGVGERPELRRQFGELPSEHHTGVLLPGLINAHTHLELSYQSADALRAGPQAVAIGNRVLPVTTDPESHLIESTGGGSERLRAARMSSCTSLR